jgi:hypothetical protein
MQSVSVCTPLVDARRAWKADQQPVCGLIINCVNGSRTERLGEARVECPTLERLVICFLSVGHWIIPAAAQSTDEIRPELGIYIQQGPVLRVELIDSFRANQSTHDWNGDFAVYVQIALKPVFHRELRKDPDVFRNKYLTLRAGYRYQTSLTSGRGGSENRGILELTSRYRLPWQLVISDRNRADFRSIKGQPFSMLYRNRLRLERDVRHGWLNCTPYVYDEIFYDTRYDRWTPNRYVLGAEFPVGQHVVLEPYYLRQDSSRSNPPHINAFGFKLNLYL